MTLSYGPLSNQKLLTYYGFVLERNPFDTFPFDLDLDVCAEPYIPFRVVFVAGRRRGIQRSIDQNERYGGGFISSIS